MNDIKRGEIFYISRGGVTTGHEQYADRPAIVVSNDANNAYSETVEVVYLTTQPKTDLPTHVTIRSTGRVSTALCEQVTSVSTDRINNYFGQVSEQEMKNIDIALTISLQLEGAGKTSKKYTETIEKQEQEIKGLREQLENAKNEIVKMQQESTKTPDKALMASARILIRAESERDTYKRLYEQIFDKLMNGGSSIMMKSGLKALFINAKTLNTRYIGVRIETEGSSQPEIIINPRENFDAKYDYYMEAYDDDLVLISTKGKKDIRITGIAQGNTFEDIEYQLCDVGYGWKVPIAEAIDKVYDRMIMETPPESEEEKAKCETIRESIKGMFLNDSRTKAEARFIIENINEYEKVFEICMNGDDMEFRKALVNLQKKQNEAIVRNEND